MKIFLISDVQTLDQKIDAQNAQPKTYRRSIYDIRSDRPLSGSYRYLRSAFLQHHSTKKRVRHPYGTWCGKEPNYRDDSSERPD